MGSCKCLSVGIFHILGIENCHHFRELYNQMPLYFSVYIIIIHFLQVIRKPVIFHGKETQKSGFTGSLTTYQAEHYFKLDARA